MKWISVENELPENDATVHVKCKSINHENPVYGHGNCITKWLGVWEIGLLSGPESYPLPTVTHWYPLHDKDGKLVSLKNLK